MLTKVKHRFIKTNLWKNLMWMYFNIGSNKKKAQWHDVGLSLFLWFVCKITIYKNIQNWLMIISYFKSLIVFWYYLWKCLNHIYNNLFPIDNYEFIAHNYMHLIDKFCSYNFFNFLMCPIYFSTWTKMVFKLNQVP
jgi:hypothetical protein